MAEADEQRGIMLNFKHTPGKWEAGIMENADGTRWLGVATGDPVEGRECVSILISPESDINEMDIANARVIRRAPDMLCALVMAYACHLSGTNITGEEADMIKEVIESASGMDIKDIFTARQEAER